jgi:hypothetical protein
LTIEIILGGGVVAQRARAEDLEAQNRLLRCQITAVRLVIMMH